jgi:hypothetical protein
MTVPIYVDTSKQVDDKDHLKVFASDPMRGAMMSGYRDIEPRFVCGKRGADVRPDFNWKEKPVAMMGYR